MKATVRLPTTEYVVDIDARDRRAFERQSDVALPPTGSLQELAQRMPETYLAWLAWHASKREGVAMSWREFDEVLLEVSQDEGGDDMPDPTQSVVTGD